MGFVIPGYSSDGLLARKAKVDFRDDLIHEKDITAEANVRVTAAYFSYDDVRPGLMLDGRIEAVRGEFPFDVHEIEFLEEYLQPQVSIRYELTNEELAKLCLYGLFDHGREGPQVPELFLDNIFEIPMECDCTALPPENQDSAPLMFVHVQDPFSMTTSSEESGYDIKEYFDIEPEREMEGAMLDLDMTDEAELEDDIFRVDQEQVEVPIEDESEEAVDDEPEDKDMTSEERELQSIFASIEQTLDIKRPAKMDDQRSGERDIGDDDDDFDF